MREKHLYEYAVIRVVPAVEREEFCNVGLILFCKKEKYIRVLSRLNSDRLKSFACDLDNEQVQNNLIAFEKIALGEKDGGPIAELDLPSRFRWLTAVRSTSIQTSRPHPGMCDDLDSTTERLFRELVL
jgi:hypothetical protein